MKYLVVLVLSLMMTSSYAQIAPIGGNASSTTAGSAVSRSMSNEPMGTEATDRRTNTGVMRDNQMRTDTIGTSQSATRRNTTTTPAGEMAPANNNNTQPVTTCIDRGGRTYYQNDSGYSACVNTRR